jgi:hypothetical protein
MAAGAVELSLAWQNNKGAAAAVFGGEGEALREVVHRMEKKMAHRCSPDSPNETQHGGSTFWARTVGSGVATCASDSGHREVAMVACDAWRAVRGMHSSGRRCLASGSSHEERLIGGPHVEEHPDLNKPEIKS